MVGLAGSVVFYTLFGVATAVQSLALLFISRIGAGIAGATIPTAQAYIADSTTLEQRPRGMALIGMAFGLGFTFGPLVAYLAVPGGHGDPGPWPGYVAALLSLGALLLAVFKLPESKRSDSQSAARRILDLGAFRAAVSIPSIAMLLLALFVCVFSFATYETTLSMLLKGSPDAPSDPFHFGFQQVCLTYAYIGFVLAVVQGGVVRRLAGRVSEAAMSVGGAVVELLGYALMIPAVSSGSVPLVLTAAGLVVSGFSMMQPNLNSLLSRRSDPARQGAIMGVGQSVSSLARILGAGLGIPLLKMHWNTPYFISAGLMALGLVVVIAAARGGADYAADR
jgi:MFS family permease